MKQSEEAFTMMETLLSVAIVLILGSLLVVSSSTAFQGAAKSINAVNTAAAITRIDRHIRTGTGAIHVPYWADSAPFIDAFISELYRSKTCPYIKSVRIISDNKKVPRGIEVTYTVNNRETRTAALFSSNAVMDGTQ